MASHYYILDKASYTNKQGLKEGVVIIKLPELQPIPFDDGEGPYSTLENLKKNSRLYKNLKRNDLKRAQQILQDRHIVKVAEMMLVPHGTEFSPEVIDMFTHATTGRVKNGNITGIHFYDPNKVKLIEIVNKNQSSEVFEAQIEFYDSKTGNWLTKNSTSTFFPMSWNKSRLLAECNFAFEKIEHRKPQNGRITSITKGNINVELIFKNGKLKSIYPLF